jgi:hypothetical protein
MKRSVVALGILGLVCAVALPSANAAVLLKDDFNTKPFKGIGTLYTQGLGNGTNADPDNPVIPFTVREYSIEDVDGTPTKTLSDPDVIKNGVLDWGDGDGISLNADPDNVKVLRHILLTGDPAWADVAIQVKLWSFNQDTGIAGLVLRAAPKTKPEDPDSFYELRYSTGGEGAIVGAEEEASGIAPPVGNPNLRIMKVVNNKWTMLAETDNDRQTAVTIPAVNNTGEDNLTGMTIRFVAKGSLLQGFVSLAGQEPKLVIQATDGDLKAGRVGFHTYDYRPLSDDLLVEDAP